MPRRLLPGLLGLLLSLAAQAAPVISIIIDDMGDNRARGERALALPGAVSYAFLPHTPYAAEQARQAHRLGRDVLLHLPMEPQGPAVMGRGGLRQDMSQEEFLRTLQADLAAVPFVMGINNHMGSLLTQARRPMQWLMSALARQRGLFFVDSLTTLHSVAGHYAGQYRVPHLRRDVFLDHDKDFDALAHHLQRLLKKARRQGRALAIAHPHNETLAFLEQQIPRLAAQGIRLVPVSQQLAMENPTWQAFLSPSPRAVKN